MLAPVQFYRVLFFIFLRQSHKARTYAKEILEANRFYINQKITVKSAQSFYSMKNMMRLRKS